MIIDEEIYLSHYGVKGQKWGVRKNRISSTNTSKEKRSINKKRAVQVSVIGGAIVAAALIAHKSGVRPSSFRNTSSLKSGSKEAEKILSKIGQERFQAIPMGPVPKVSSPKVKSGSSDSAALRSSISKLIKAANSDLRANDNALNIPFSQRSYLTEWD